MPYTGRVRLPGQRPSSRRVIRALALGVLVSVGVTALSHVGVLAGWETRAVDAFLFFRDREPSPDIAVALVDEDAFRELGERQPLSRRYLADLGELLLQSGARVVAFDVQFLTPTAAEEDDALLALCERWQGRGQGRLVFASVATPRNGEAMVTTEPTRRGRRVAAPRAKTPPRLWPMRWIGTRAQSPDKSVPSFVKIASPIKAVLVHSGQVRGSPQLRSDQSILIIAPPANLKSGAEVPVPFTRSSAIICPESSLIIFMV